MRGWEIGVVVGGEERVGILLVLFLLTWWRSELWSEVSLFR